MSSESSLTNSACFHISDIITLDITRIILQIILQLAGYHRLRFQCDLCHIIPPPELRCPDTPDSQGSIDGLLISLEIYIWTCVVGFLNFFQGEVNSLVG